MDTNGREGSVLISEVSSFQRLKCTLELYLGWEKVSRLERCPQFRSVLIEGFHVVLVNNVEYCRFGGERFPPVIMFKIFISGVAMGVQYFSGKKMIRPASEVCFTNST